MNGDRRYAAVLTFDEAVILPSGEEVGLDGHPLITSGGGEEDEKMEADNLQSLSLALGHHPMVPGVSLPGLADNSLLFAPKCLLLISRHDDPDLLRNVLGVVYTTYSEGLVGAGGERVRLETVVGNLLGSVYMPPPGGPQVRFSLGATDKMTLQPPMYGQVPVTGTKVAMLFQQMGIRNVLTLFCAAMTELKILFYSQSFNRLTEACTALIALMYPMKYMHVFIPVLPASIGELWSSPTPFIIGVHSSREGEIIDLLDVVRVDLDGGSITIPENMTIHMVPQSLLSKVQLDLCSVLHPDLAVADDAFGRSFSSSASSSSSVRRKPLVSLDKELRAVMLRLMVQLLSGYRSCLTLVRIHPQPYITFHKAAFLGLSNLYDSEFVRRMLECMFFNTFISERGLPWRQCDIFDEAYSAYSDQCVLEQTDPSRVLVHIQMLAEQFYRNENPITTLNQPYSQKIPQPAEGASKRIHQPVFPVLDGQMVTDVMQKGIEKLQLE